MSPPAHPEDIAEQRRIDRGAETGTRVFIVQRPTQRDPATGAVVPSMDLSPVNEWGQPVFILRDSENPFADPDATALEVERVLRSEGYGEDDYLLLVGNPCLLGIVAAVASSFQARLSMLQWSRADHGYRLCAVNLPD